MKKYVLLFISSFILFIIFSIFNTNVYAHDNWRRDCVHIANTWVSCGTANICNGPNLVNDNTTCFIEADGVTHSSCTTAFDEVHSANDPSCAPTPTPPCTPAFGPWTPLTCGGSWATTVCAANQRLEYRSTTTSCGGIETRCVDDATCSSPPPVPACGVGCTTSAFCAPAATTDGCSECTSGPLGSTCQRPTGGSCNGSCDPSNPTECPTRGGAGCTCNATTRVCTPPSGGSCNGSCDPSNPTECPTRGGAGCTCNATTRVCTPPTTTSGARCQCDGLTFSGTIGPGLPITITARARATGTSVTCPTTVYSYDFTLYEGPKGSADTNSIIRNVVNNIPTITLTSSIANTVLCQSSWSLTLPTDRTKEYRILAKANKTNLCTSGITRAESEMETLALLPVTNNDKTVIGFVKEFFNKLLGFSSYIAIPANAQGDQLQLNTFLPDGAIYSNNCNLIKFAFE